MPTRYFLEEDYLESKIASPVTEANPQNYFHLELNSELDVALVDFANCLDSTIVTDPVSHEDWSIADIPVQYVHNWKKVIYAPGIGYVAIALDSQISAPGMVMTSTDGTAWTLRTTPDGSLRKWENVIYVASKNLLVAVTQTRGGFNLVTSSDGITWTVGKTSGTVPSLIDIVWSEAKSLYVVVAGFSFGMKSSPDLITWTDAVVSPYLDSPTCVTYSPALGIFCAIDFYGISYTSSDGINWTFTQLGGGNWDSNWFEIEWSDTLGIFLAQGELHGNFTNPHPYITSPDGIVWTQRPLGIALTQHDAGADTFLPVYGLRWDTFTSKFYSITSGDNNFSGSLMTPSMYVLTSPDGIAWTIDATAPGTHEFTYPVFLNSKFRDMAFMDATNRIILSDFAVAFYTGT